MPTWLEVFSQSCYVELQIGYDVVLSEQEKLQKTSLPKITFTGAKSNEKALYELSGCIYYFYKWNGIKQKELADLKLFLANLKGRDFIDQNPDLSIERSHPVPKIFNGIEYQWTQVKYPMLIDKFGKYEILTEIIIKENNMPLVFSPCYTFVFLLPNYNLLFRL